MYPENFVVKLYTFKVENKTQIAGTALYDQGIQTECLDHIR